MQLFRTQIRQSYDMASWTILASKACTRVTWKTVRMDLVTIISTTNTIHTNNLITALKVNTIRATIILLQILVAGEVISEEAIKDTQEEGDKIIMAVGVAISRTITEVDMIIGVEEEIMVITIIMAVVIITRDEGANENI